MRVRLAVLVVMVSVVGVACGAAYSGQPMDYGGRTDLVQPAFLGIHVQYVTTGTDPSNAECVLGLTSAGAGVIGTAMAAPVGVVAWIVFGTVAAGTVVGGGQMLGDCWSKYQFVKPAFDVYTQCPVNHPVLKSTFDSYAQATAYVDMASCKCSLACQLGYEDAPGMPFSMFAMVAGQNYWHDGANRVEGPTTGDPPPPPDFNAMAASMGLTYAGCDGVGEYVTSALPPAVCQSPTG